VKLDDFLSLSSLLTHGDGGGRAFADREKKKLGGETPYTGDLTPRKTQTTDRNMTHAHQANSHCTHTHTQKKKKQKVGNTKSVSFISFSGRSVSFFFWKSF
jgi:ABC-type nickel/cobalt efflux system permease component RcnA